jgi:hypothetical protein
MYPPTPPSPPPPPPPMPAPVPPGGVIPVNPPESHNNLFNIGPGATGVTIVDLPAGCSYYRVTVTCPGQPRNGTIKWYSKGLDWQPASARPLNSTDLVFDITEHPIDGRDPNLKYVIKVPQGHTQLKFVMEGFTPGEIYVGGDAIAGP